MECISIMIHKGPCGGQRMDGWMDVWMDGFVDVWMDEKTGWKRIGKDGMQKWI